MAGEANDIARLEAIVASSPISPELLDAIGRFGNPLAWSFLLHFLADRELGDAAGLALFTLFGPLVPPEATRNRSVWRDALSERDLDPAMRYRRGELWSPAILVRDCGFGEPSHIEEAHSQRALECRLDELGARTGVAMGVQKEGSNPAPTSGTTPPPQGARRRARSERSARPQQYAGA
jgi:hypothetical protein